MFGAERFDYNERSVMQRLIRVFSNLYPQDAGDGILRRCIPRSRRRRASRLRSGGYGGGFTMVEVVILLAIFSLVASVVLVSFPAFSQRINIQRTAVNLALSLRKAQNMAFAVRQAPTAPPQVPPAYGLYFNRVAMPNSYLIFADFSPAGSPNGRYDPPPRDTLIETVTLGPGITWGEFTSDLGGANQPQDILNVSFSVPEARVGIANAAQSVGESAEIVLLGRTGIRRSIILRTTGQISVR